MSIWDVFIAYHIYWFNRAMDTENGFQIGIGHRVVVTNHQKPLLKKKKNPIGLAVRIDLLKNCNHAAAWSRYVGPQKSEATL